MSLIHRIVPAVAVLLTVLIAGERSRQTAAAQDAEDSARDARRAKTFAIIFNYGYAGDHFPQDKAAFEKVIQSARQADFNVILCKYDPWRAEICKKHGMKIMVDLLASEHHVYKNVDATKKLCESLRRSDVIYGYHLWSDNIGNTYPGRSRDVKNVQSWDGTHPAYVGSYRMSRVSRVENLDLLGYYDFHWKRGGHWGHLAKASRSAKAKDAGFLRYCDAAPGRIGAGNYNRALYTVSTSIVFGLKGYMFHYGGGVINKTTGQLDALGKDLQKLNAHVAPLGPELLKLRSPTAIYSTPTTKTAKDRPTGQPQPTVPAGFQGVPADLWVQVESGEALFGMFQDRQQRDALVLANHNAYQPQDMKLSFKKPIKSVSLFSRDQGKWQPLKITDGSVSFQIAPAGLQLLRIEK